MKLKNKKIIARESLYLLSAITLMFLFYLTLIGYNQIKNIKNNRLHKNLISIEHDSLMIQCKSKIEKQVWLYKSFSENYSNYYESSDALWDRLTFLYANDSIVFKYNRIWSKELINFFQKLGLNSPQSINQFIERNRITSEEVNKLKTIEKIKSEINDNNHDKLTLNKMIELSWLTFGIILIILFVLRYIYYTVHWSIKILNTPDNNV
jgi:hypothetical protein